ncbi:MAG: Bpu10I family restriction endonuclease [Verrucomicrobiae bacterium]|nr:Bpu10I family restriction endonuclease [Verrucomicrobiae bacterium]
MHVHGDNLHQKETAEAKYADAEARKFLREVRKQYDVWKKANESLKGPLRTATPKDSEILTQRVALFTAYKDFIDQQKYAEKFDSRSNLHSSVLEEFIYYLFRDLVAEFAERALIGKSHTFKDIFFMPPNYDAMLESPHARIERKDHDFAIGVSVSAVLNSAGQEKGEVHHFQIPAVAIECKTYLDKTMLEGASMAAEQLKFRNPNALYLVVSEWLKLTENVNLRKFKVDQIYVLRKQKNTDREYRFLPDYEKNPVYLDVVEHLFNTVRAHLTSNWEGGVSYGLQRGYLL